MNDPVFSSDVRPLSELKASASELVDQAARTQRPILITRRGRGVAVLLDLASYERLREELQFAQAVEQGARQAARGELVPQSEVLPLLKARK